MVRDWSFHSSSIKDRNAVSKFRMSDRAASPDQDLRCDCGRLVARIESRGIVIKCNRCGELVVIDLPTLQQLVKAYEAAP